MAVLAGPQCAMNGIAGDREEGPGASFGVSGYPTMIRQVMDTIPGSLGVSMNMVIKQSICSHIAQLTLPIMSCVRET